MSVITMTKKEKVEFSLLSILSENEEPMGSAALCLLLKEQDLNVSGATVGRILNEFDHGGLTEKFGFKGRVLTRYGNTRIAEYKQKLRLAQYSTKFYETVDAQNKDDLLNVLVARRGIEREAARLAAINATDEDIEQIQYAWAEQQASYRKGLNSSDADVKFHRSVANASKNAVLSAAYDFIWQNGKLSLVMEYIRKNVGGKIAVDHNRILNAVLARDSANAELCMVNHIDSLIEDVSQYWSLVHNDLVRSDKETGADKT